MADENRAAVPPVCDHLYASKHQPGHLLYWIRQCMICHEVDWDALDRETEGRVAAERERIAAELDGFAQMARDASAGYPRDPGPVTTGEARLEMEGRASAYVKAAEIARGATGGEGWGEP